MSQYMGLDPLGADALSLSLESAFNNIDDVSTVVTQAVTTSGLDLSLAPLWQIQTQLAPSAVRVDFAAGLMAQPLPMRWFQPAHVTGPGSWITQAMRMAQCPDNGGDLGGYLTQRALGELTVAGEGATGARALATAMFDYLHGPNAVAPDEFAAFKLDEEGQHVVVALPGVMDLNRFGRPWCAIGYDDQHESYRDVDQEALKSWPRADLSENGYGLAIKEWFEQSIEAGDIAPGASVAIIGHSFGSDTAFDLASSPEFNGDLVNVEFVVGAAYDNETFFDAIPESTQVLSLRNRKDIPALVEEKGRGFFGKAWDFTTTAISNPGEAVLETAQIVAINGHQIFGDFPPLVTAASDTITHVTFPGGWSGAGHDPSHYTDYLESPGAESVHKDFWTAMAAAGFIGGGAAFAVDVSRPSEDDESDTSASVGGDRGTDTEVNGERATDAQVSGERGTDAEVSGNRGTDGEKAD